MRRPLPPARSLGFLASTELLCLLVLRYSPRAPLRPALHPFRAAPFSTLRVTGNKRYM